MQWLNEPAGWQRSGDLLKLSVDPGTDFWRETGYGYIHDNGHVYGEVIAGDLDVSVRVRASFTSHYDQAGIMLRVDERTWLKTGLENFEGRARLSTVLTLGQSSWTVADLPEGADEVALRASRRGDAVEVRYTVDGGASELAALVYLPPGSEVLAGIMCAAPEGPGFSVTFHDLRIVGRSWGGDGGAGEQWDEPAPQADAEWDGDGGAGEQWDEPAPQADADWDGDAAGAAWAPAPRQADQDEQPDWLAPAPEKEDEEAAAQPWREDGELNRPEGPAADDGWLGVRDEQIPGWAKLPAPNWGDSALPDPAADWELLSAGLSEHQSAGPAANGGDGGQESGSGGAPDDITDATEPGLALAALRPDASAPPTDAIADGTPEGEESSAGGGTPADEEAEKPPGGMPRAGKGAAKTRGKPKPTVPPPADPADEWISLLTADPADD